MRGITALWCGARGEGTRAAGGREKQHHHGGRQAAGGRAPARCMWASNSNDDDKQQGQLRSGEPPRQTGQNRKSMIQQLDARLSSFPAPRLLGAQPVVEGAVPGVQVEEQLPRLLLADRVRCLEPVQQRQPVGGCHDTHRQTRPGPRVRPASGLCLMDDLHTRRSACGAVSLPLLHLLGGREVGRQAWHARQPAATHTHPPIHRSSTPSQSPRPRAQRHTAAPPRTRS